MLSGLKAVKRTSHGERRTSAKYKKRLYRLSQHQVDSPRTKTRHLLRHLKTDRVRKTLTFHYALLEDLKQKYKDTKEERSKQLFGRVVTGKIVKRYRLQKFAMENLGIAQKRWTRFNRASQNTALNRFERSQKLPVAVAHLQENIKDFFTRDDVSRMTPGKKQTITRKKQKMQKRLLSDTLKVLHLKYLAENPLQKISYSLFCRLRPFWVTIPTTRDRETCLCRTHENMAFIVAKMRELKLIPRDDLSLMVDSLACDPKSIECAYGNCSECKSNKINVSENFDPLQQIECWQWISEKEGKMTKNGMKEQRITREEKITARLLDFVDEFHLQLRKFQRHLFNIRHQFRALRQLRESLSNTECIVQLDFAENYLCRYSSEIQAVHFGASHQQATLHDVVIHVGAIPDAMVFCTVSKSSQHDPPAIWEYLDPVLKYIRINNPDVDTVHFYSDGPSTQYRQKKNFFLFSTKSFEYGFSLATWNYFEAGHGKGAPDGVGGALKRTADRILSNGVDIPDAVTLFNVLSKEDGEVKLFYTDTVSVEKATEQLAEYIPAIPGTMGIHQLVSSKPGVLDNRPVSCFCSVTSSLHCKCYDTKTFVFPGYNEDGGVESSGGSPQVPQQRWDGLEHLNPDDADTCGKWCVLRYEDNLYPGVIIDIDEVDVQVRCMACIGVNRFFWPMIEDIIWYRHDDIVCLIPEPKQIGSRHVEIDRRIWSQINQDD